MRRETRTAWLVGGLVALVLTVFLFYPVGHVLVHAVRPKGRWTGVFLWNVIANPTVRHSLVTSLLLGLATTLGTFLLSLPLALAASRRDFPGKDLLSGACLLPLVLPPFVGAVGAKQLLARFGSLNLLLMDLGLADRPLDFLGSGRFWGVVALQVLHLYPIMYLNLLAALAAVDRSLEEAARNLGAPAHRVFFRVTLPLAAPGVFAGAILVFIWAFTDLGTPLVFQFREVLSVQVFERITDMQENPEGYALVVWILLLTSLVFLTARRLLSRRAAASGKGARRAGLPPLRGAGLAGTYAAFGLVVGLAILPHLAVLATALQGDWFMSVLPESYTLAHFRAALAHPLTVSSIRNSLLYAGGATVLDVLVGLAVAQVLVRYRGRLAAALDTAVMLPLALPGIVVAFGYLGAFAGTVLDPRKDPTVLLIIAYAIRRLPYMVRSAHAGLSQVDPAMEEAAWNLGATPWRTLRRVTLPLLAASLLAGAILTFSFAVMEVSDSLILALREEHYPITKAIYVLLGRLSDGPELACALGVWAMAFLALALLLAHRALGKRLGDVFRA